MSERKREAFVKWVMSQPGSMIKLDLIMELAWPAYQQAYEDMFPVFDRIKEVINKGGSIYDPLFGGCKEHEDWEIFDANKDVIARGKTFQELCVNLIMADGKDNET